MNDFLLFYFFSVVLVLSALASSTSGTGLDFAASSFTRGSLGDERTTSFAFIWDCVLL